MLDGSREEDSVILTTVLRELFEAPDRWMTIRALERAVTRALTLRTGQFESTLERLILSGCFPSADEKGYRFHWTAVWLADKLDQRSTKAAGDSQAWRVADELRALARDAEPA